MSDQVSNHTSSFQDKMARCAERHTKQNTRKSSAFINDIKQLKNDQLAHSVSSLSKECINENELKLRMINEEQKIIQEISSRFNIEENCLKLDELTSYCTIIYLNKKLNTEMGFHALK